MKLTQIRELFKVLSHHARRRESYGYKTYERVEVLSAEKLGKRVEMMLRLPPMTMPHNSFGKIQRTALCGIVDAATSVTAWFANPLQRVSLSVDMNFAFIDDPIADQELLIRAVCEDVVDKLGYTIGEVTQGGKLVVSAKHTVFFLDKSLSDAFHLPA